MVREMERDFSTFGGDSFHCLQQEVLNLETEKGMARFLEDDSTLVEVPGTGEKVRYNHRKKIGVALTGIGTSRAISLGAYAFALSHV